MAFAILSGVQASGIFLLLSAVFMVCGIIPFWFRHGTSVIEGDWETISQDEEPIPVLSILFLMLAFSCVGSFRYISALNFSSQKHLHSVLSKYDASTTWKIRGQVIEEPKLKKDHLEVLISPQNARRVISKRVEVVEDKSKKRKSRRKRKKKKKYEIISEDSKPMEVAGGLILVRIFEDSDAFRTVRFNQKVEIEGRLVEPSRRRNPGSLDYHRYLRNRGIFRTLTIAQRKSEFTILGDDPSGSKWYRFALYIKTEVLKVIKQTLPYPESSFLGGVLLGLKGGLPQNVTQEFRMTGVSHVLAVSGLHVTIIAALLYGIFTVLKIPLRVFAPLIVFALFTFALIVGWPSSAVRAALMNSLFILSRAYLKDRGFKLSVIFSLCVAADYILTMSPLQITEPSFVLSVMAIYALAMFSDPSADLLKKILRGKGLFFAVFALFGFFMAVIIKRDLVLQPYFFKGAFFYVIGSAVLANYLAKTSTFQSFSFEMLPKWLQGFLASQIAIFLAMMGPLSAFYFGQMSLAAPIANLIAIPLIGIIVQIGLIAGLIGAFVPVVGLKIALVINAANWLAVKFFLGMAHLFAAIIPFPRISQPGFTELVIYYAILHLFFFWKDLREYVKAIIDALVEIWEDPDYRMSISLTGGVLLVAVLVGAFLTYRGLGRVPDFRVTLLDVGYGSSIMIEKKDKVVLVDSGLNDSLAGYDMGERVVLPAFSSRKIKEVDAVILSSILPERISGLAAILNTYKVKKIYAPFSIPTDGKRLNFEKYVANYSLDDRKMKKRLKKGQKAGVPANYFWELAHESFNQLIKLIHEKNIKVAKIKAGDVLPELGKAIEILYPKKEKARFSAYYDSLILKVSGEGNNFLICSGNVRPLDKLKSFKVDAVLLSDLPFPYSKFERYIKTRKPKAVGISFRMPSSWLVDGYYLANTLNSRKRSSLPRFEDWIHPVYWTGKNGAIELEVNSHNLVVKPYIK
jgi:predicted membrane metal-binding protein